MEAVASTVGKAALAQILGWTRPKLDRRLQSDAAFPVVQQGNQAGGWAFNPDAVKSYLGIGPKRPAKKSAAKAPAVDKAQLRDAMSPPVPQLSVAPTVQQSARKTAHHQGEATARQRKDAADAALRENKLKIENGDLVVKSELRQDLADLIASIGNDLDAVPEQLANLLGSPDEMPRIRDFLDKVRTRMVANAAPLLSDD